MGKPWVPCSLGRRRPAHDTREVVSWGTLVVAMTIQANILKMGLSWLLQTGGPTAINSSVLTFGIISPLANIFLPALLFLGLRPLLSDHRKALGWVAIAAALGPIVQLLHIALLPRGTISLLIGLVTPYTMAGALAVRKWPR